MRLRGYMGDIAVAQVLPRRKAAWAGPRVKAGRRASQAERTMLRGMMGDAKTDLVAKIGGFLKQFGPVAGEVLKSALKAKKVDVGSVGFLPGFEGGAAAPSRNGNGRRRSINPANVKALRRGIRRMEGFRTLVKRVDKALPPAARVSAPRSRSHGRGCKCPSCK